MIDMLRRIRIFIPGLMIVLASVANAQTPEEGLDLYRGGQYERARNVWAAVLEQDPGNVQARTYLGLTLLELGRLPDAQRELEQAARTTPGPELVHIGLARVYTEQRRFNLAAGALQRAERINPESVDLFYYRGLLRLAQSQFQPAALDLERALEMDPTRTQAHYYAGLAYNGLRQPDKMVSHFQTYLSLEPDAPEAPRIRSLLRGTR